MNQSKRYMVQEQILSYEKDDADVWLTHHSTDDFADTAKWQSVWPEDYFIKDTNSGTRWNYDEVQGMIKQGYNF